MTIAPKMVERVSVLLGRDPRGLEEIAVQSADGEPVVIRVSSLVDDKPFPTLFWLVDAELTYRIDQLEASGLIMQFQQQIDADQQIQVRMHADHVAHIALRDQYMDIAVRRRLQQLGYSDAFAGRGIGGIANFTRIRCLHTWYGAHLVVPNTVGVMLEEWWRRNSN
ncbi:MAG: DUF501 domain-containing protein [Halioglobus sp.]